MSENQVNASSSLHQMLQNQNLDKTCPQPSLRSPRTHPNFKTKKPEIGVETTGIFSKNFLFCEQSRPHFTNLSNPSRGCSSNGDGPEVNGTKKKLTEVRPKPDLGEKSPTGQALQLQFYCGSSSSSLSSTEDVYTGAKPVSKPRRQQRHKIRTTSESLASLNFEEKLFKSLSAPPRSTTCHNCGLFGSLRCSQCKQTYYCSEKCQKKDWSAHSNICKPVKQSTKVEEVNRFPSEKLEDAKPKVDTTKEDLHIKKKVNLSHFKNLGLTKGMQIQVAVTDFKNPSHFFVQIHTEKTIDYLSKITLAMTDSYADVNCHMEYIPETGEVCVAKYTQDQNWYRALVQAVDQAQKKASILYIDYGNGEEISLDRIRPLLKEIELFPPCAVQCFIPNVTPVDGYWNEECINSVRQLLLGQPTVVTILDVLHNDTILVCCAVDIMFPNTGESLDKYLLKKGYSSDQVNKNNMKTTMDFGVVMDKTLKEFREAKVLETVEKEECEDLQSPQDNLLSYRQLSLNTAAEFLLILPLILLLEQLAVPNLQGSLLHLPVQAIKCALSGVKPPLETWSPEAIAVMKKLVSQKILEVRVTGTREENTAVVELLDKSVDPVVNVAEHLVSASWAAEEGEMSMTSNASLKKDVPTVNQAEYLKGKFSINQTMDVIMCFICSPGEFYCQCSNAEDLYALNGMNNSLNEYCCKLPPDDDFRPVKGEPCCAFFTSDGNWYRAMVKESFHGTVMVYFVDYGNVEEITVEKLRPIHPQFLKLPVQAIKCSLAGVKPFNKEWTTEAMAHFRALTAGVQLHVKIVSTSENDVGVELTNSSSGTPLNIGEVLVKKKLAVMETDQAEVLLSEEHTDISSLEQWKTVELPLNETLSMLVMDVVNPGLFYALQFTVKVAEQKLYALMTDLAEYGSKQSANTTFIPRIGEICCARFTGDNNWYRAIALEASDVEVKVLYVDYGNVEILQLSRILPIQPYHLELPFQIIKCKLSGIEMLAGKWLPAAKDLLRALLLNKEVKATVKEVHENIHSVTIITELENGCINVADRLVMEGLAKYCSNNQMVLSQEPSQHANCCCKELQEKVERHEEILLFLLRKHIDPADFSQM
nr:PREDICTED: tudor domain-containing protein 1 isoform X6 [Latimeria chalumnae]|eukprot:XP_014348096.1 PREDICTED: tudor domain-containing protein 1 isoform X6 [Latimeria chalumnae]